jgi:hypothetical protein
MKKTFTQNGKLYLAEKVGSYTPPKEKPVRITDEYVIPRHTSLFVKTLQETIESNLEDYFVEMKKQSEQLKKQSYETVISGNLKQGMALLQKAKDIDNTIQSCKNKFLIEWMSMILIRYEDLTKQIVSRLPM